MSQRSRLQAAWCCDNTSDKVLEDGSAQVRCGVSLKSRWRAARAGMTHAMKVRRWLGAGEARYEPREPLVGKLREAAVTRAMYSGRWLSASETRPEPTEQAAYSARLA